jgi:hypothetical protein
VRSSPFKSWALSRAVEEQAGRLVADFSSSASGTSDDGASRVFRQWRIRSEGSILFHFAQFVEWPPDAFQNPTSPLIYCTIGEDPFHGGLDESLRGKSVGARTIEVRHVKQPQEVHGCQILFIAAGEKKRAGDVMATTVGHPILTVGENEGFVQSGGMIGFCLAS